MSDLFRRFFGRDPDYSSPIEDGSASTIINRLCAEGRGSEVTDELRERLKREIDYADRNRKASRGEQSHDYCHGRGDCISCGCSAQGPCVSHRPLKPPVYPRVGDDPYRLAKVLERRGISDVSGSLIMAQDIIAELSR